MKRLDEVIKACEETVSDVDRGVDIEGCYLGATETKDALYYLNEYATSLHNEPLTWSELKQMIGKPVWVEIGDGSKGWVIIRKINEAGILFGSDGFIGIECLYGMDATWKAYRKEVK